MQTVLTFVGRTASGKSTLARKLARYIRTSHIEVSDVIRTLHNEHTRANLAATSRFTKDDPEWLGRAISKEIDKAIERDGKTLCVISGVREIEVIHFLEELYRLYGFEVRAEIPIRYQRSIDDGKYNSADAFIKGEIRELDLGIQEVEDWAPFAVPTSPLTDPDRIVKATVKLLRAKGVALR